MVYETKIDMGQVGPSSKASRRVNCFPFFCPRNGKQFKGASEATDRNKLGSGFGDMGSCQSRFSESLRIP